jgi:hypothetical protein
MPTSKPSEAPVKKYLVRGKIPIYNIPIWISVAPSMKQAFEALPTGFRVKSEYHTNCKAQMVTNGNGIFAFLFIPNHLTHGAIAHETLHLINDMFEYIGQDDLEPGDEVVTYPVDWVVQWVHRHLKKSGITVK